MMNPFQGIGDLKKMRDQAMAIQKQLQQEIVMVDKHGVKVKMTGDQKIVFLETNGKSDKDVMEAINEALKKSQEAAAKRLSSMSGGLAGLLGK